MVLSTRGLTQWRIVVSKCAPTEVKLAAHDLKRFLFDVTGATFMLYDDTTPFTCKEIIIGNNAHTEQSGVAIDYASLGNEGYAIRTYDGGVVIAGNKPRGTVYGVYGFLEDYIGLRFYTKDFTYIPKRATLHIGCIDDTQVPVLEYRDPFYGQNFDPDWHVRNKSNTTMANLDVMHGGKMKYKGFVHTFEHLISPDDYFDEHPEYFSMIDGVRIKEKTQLCLTHPDVLKLVIDKVKQWMQDEPDTNLISVSQNDWINPCQCPGCKAIDDAEGTQAGTLITFVNQVAEALEDEYPDLIIDTLAYQYTRKAPKTIRPHKNVAVRLCSIECCFAHPLSECTVMASFKKRDWARDDFAGDIKEWAKVCDRLHIWDYVTNFAHYLSPFPNFKVLKENIRFFIDNHVTGIFEEGNTAGDTPIELNALRQYALAKLLWNPDLDVDRIVNEFISIYYGGAAQAIREYFDLIHAQLTPDTHMGIYDLPTREYYPPEMIAKAEELFARAEMLADNDTVLDRVKLCGLSVKYLKMAQTTQAGTPERIAAVDAIVDAADWYGVKEIREGAPNDKWREKLKAEELRPVND